jgi:hypothetical protein
MDLVGYAVARPAEVNAVSRARRLEEPVIVGVLEIRVQNIVVHILDGQCLDGAETEGLELEHGERTRSILEQCVVNPKADLRIWREFALDEMVTEYLLGKVPFHGSHQNTASGEDMFIDVG